MNTSQTLALWSLVTVRPGLGIILPNDGLRECDIDGIEGDN